MSVECGCYLMIDGKKVFIESSECAYHDAVERLAEYKQFAIDLGKEVAQLEAELASEQEWQIELANDRDFYKAERDRLRELLDEIGKSMYSYLDADTHAKIAALTQSEAERSDMNKSLWKWRYLKPEVTIKFKAQDIWVGIYWKKTRSVESPYRRLDIYICLLPMIPIHLRFEWGWWTMKDKLRGGDA